MFGSTRYFPGLLGAMILCCTPTVSSAVPYTPGHPLNSNQTCAAPGDYGVTGNLTNGVCIDFFEEEDYMHLWLFGFKASPGQHLSFGWEGDFWRGDFKITAGSSSISGGIEMTIGGEVQHTHETPGPIYDLTDLSMSREGAHPNDPSPFIFSSGPAGHEDATDEYAGDFRMSPGIVRNDVGPGPNEVGFLLDMEGFHGIFATGTGDGTGLIIVPVPLPAGVLILSGALISLLGFGRLQARRSA